MNSLASNNFFSYRKLLSKWRHKTIKQTNNVSTVCKLLLLMLSKHIRTKIVFFVRGQLKISIFYSKAENRLPNRSSRSKALI